MFDRFEGSETLGFIFILENNNFVNVVFHEAAERFPLFFAPRTFPE